MVAPKSIAAFWKLIRDASGKRICYLDLSPVAVFGSLREPDLEVPVSEVVDSFQMEAPTLRHLAPGNLIESLRSL